ncbi:MAG: hypothetical protein ACLP2P_00455 [Desulfobaccales bacterium]
MVSTDPSFFISGDCHDRSYKNLRDNLLTINKILYPNRPEPRQFVESLWSRYSDLADPHFREDARNHFLERFWEMYLAVTLREREFQLKRAGSEGPEFYFMSNRCKIWVEAVVPGPGEGIGRVPEICYGKVQKVPTEKILLRFTNSLDEKRIKYKEALEKRIVNPDDLYLLAINSRGIPHGPFGNTMPFFVQAFLPFGNLAMDIDTKTRKAVETYYQYRENVIKASGAAVSTAAFLNPEFSFVSAVLHSGVDCVNHPDILGEDFMILHNPTASYPLDPSVFHWCEQMFYQEGRLERNLGQ